MWHNKNNKLKIFNIITKNSNKKRDVLAHLKKRIIDISKQINEISKNHKKEMTYIIPTTADITETNIMKKT